MKNSNSRRFRITSYINNLHPQHNKGLYSVVEQVIIRTVPLWNRTLTALQVDGGRGELNPARIPTYNGPSYGDEEEPEMEEGEDDDDYSDRLRAWRRSNVLKPEPVIFDALEFDEEAGVVLETDFADKGLQVIVKLANIQLTPEKPTYDGGSWHVEGQLVSTPYSDLSLSNILTAMNDLERAHLCNCNLLLRLREHHRQPSFFPSTI